MPLASGAEPDGNVVLVTQRATQVYSPAGERVRAIDAASTVGSAWLATAASTLVRLSVFGSEELSTEYRVAAYAADGSLRWEVVDEPTTDDDGEGPGGDEIRPQAVAVAADGTVAVSGRWFGLNILGEAFVRYYAP